jgi:hypothetical protein
LSLLWMTIWADRTRDRAVVADRPVGRERIVERDPY